MTLDPRWSVFLSLTLAVLGFLVGAGSQFTDLGFSPGQVKAILAGDTLLLGIGNAVNAVLGMIPSPSDPKSMNKFYLGPKVGAPDPGKANAPMLATIFALLFTVATAAAPFGCTPQQLNASANLFLTIGVDLVKFECNGGANLIQLVAADVGAKQRVQDALAIDTKVATDACPTLAAPTIQVLTQAAAAAKAASGG